MSTPARPPFIVVSDFDGTITTEDVTNLIWDAHLPYDWRAVLIPPSREGKISALELIARGYGDVGQTAEALLAALRPRVQLRAGFDELVALCATRGWPFRVLSHGLGFYIRAFLPPEVAVTAFEGTFQDGRWQVALPAGVTVAAGQDFKTNVVQTLRVQHPGHATVYIGDGRLDFPAARLCDRIFAVRATPLAELCADAHLPCHEFDDLTEVTAALAVP